MRYFAALLIAGALLSGYQPEAQVSKNVSLLCNWQDTADCPVNSQGQYWNDVWGFVNKGKEYAVIGGTAGAHVIDLDACSQRAFLPGHAAGVIHRDYKTYRHYLYAVADEGFYSNLQIYDFSPLPDSLHLVYESRFTELGRAHNIFIDTAKGKLYFASETDFTGHHNLTVYSLKNPVSPEWIVDIDAFANTHDVYARNDTAWCSNSFAGYLVLDMSQLPKYKVIGGLTTYPYQGYNHSSWMGYDYIGVMADETYGMPLKVIDAHKEDVIEVLSTFSPRGTDSTCIPHNPYLLGHFAFISYYMDGLQIYDLSDPRHPVQAGYYDTYPGTSVQGYLGAWGCYPYLPSRRVLVSDMQTGLYVFNVDKVLAADDARKEARISIYPNPVQDRLSIQLPSGGNGTLSYTVYSMTGAVVLKGGQELSPNAGMAGLSLPPAMPPGLYVLRAAVGGQTFIARFTKR